MYPESAYTCNDSQIISYTHSEPSNSAYLIFYHRGWDLAVFLMRIDQTLFTGLVYVPGTGRTFYNAGVVICTMVRGEGYETPPVFPLWWPLAVESQFLIVFFYIIFLNCHRVWVLHHLLFVHGLRFLTRFWCCMKGAALFCLYQSFSWNSPQSEWIWIRLIGHCGVWLPQCYTSHWLCGNLILGYMNTGYCF